MKYKEFYICDRNGKSNCVVRSLCKVFNEVYANVYNELCDITKELNSNSYSDIEVFETYMKKRDYISTNYGKDLKIKDLQLDYGKYLVLKKKKKEFYHMVSIIDNVLYDKDDRSLELYTIKVYRQNR